MPVVAGFDVGGAHLKVARIEDGRLAAVQQLHCPLWKGLGSLGDALDEANAITAGADVHAVTMTGELTELFGSREEGVAAILDILSSRRPAEIRVFMGLKGFGAIDDAKKDAQSTGSANFLATARVIAARRAKSLLIDIGSTTTDIIACDRPQGLTDAERLQTGELVYTGYTRTPVASVTTRALLAGQWQTLAGDNFANMADVRRVLSELSPEADQHETTDGRGKSFAESLARLARGFGRDADIAHLRVWKTAAEYIRERQLRAIHDGALQVLSRPGIEITNAVVAGIGESAAVSVAQRLGFTAESFGALIDAPAGVRQQATQCAPAVAVALLAAGVAS